MTPQRKTRRCRSVLPLCVGIMVFMSAQGLTEATPGYRRAESAPSGVELTQEMHAYDPAVLSIRFAQAPENPPAKSEEILDGAPFFVALQQQPVAEGQPEQTQASAAPAFKPEPVAPISTPEPGTLALLGLGIAAFALLRPTTKKTTEMM